MKSLFERKNARRGTFYISSVHRRSVEWAEILSGLRKHWESGRHTKLFSPNWCLVQKREPE